MMDFLSRLQQNIQEQELFGTSDRLLLAISGGRDSIVLLHTLKILGYSLGVAHCNFQLRGAESTGDEAFVKQLAAQLGLPFYLNRFETNSLVQSSGHSIQMVARQLRYNWLESIRQQHSFHYLLTAHHQDDSAETVLLNLIRGTGPAGLHGILPKRHKIVRPLLAFTREEIQAYASERSLEWREDSSNAQDKYDRNFLRLHVLPLLKELNPQVIQNIHSTSTHVLSMEKYIDEVLKEEKKKTAWNEKGYLIISRKHLQQKSAPHLLLYAILNDFDFSHQLVKEVLASKQIGAIFHSPTHRLLVDREHLILDKRDKGTWQPVQISNGNHNSIPFGEKTIELGEKTAWSYNNGEILVDRDKISFPILIRKWQEGDTFKPLGMSGKKKVSDFLIDSKVHLFAKEQVLVLESGDQIAAILGFRPSEDFKVTADTKAVLQVKIV